MKLGLILIVVIITLIYCLLKNIENKKVRKHIPKSMQAKVLAKKYD